jgi:hypothetical protein
MVGAMLEFHKFGARSAAFVRKLPDNFTRSFQQYAIYAKQVLRFLLVPVVSFSLLACLFIQTFLDFRDYFSGNPVWSPWSLWCELIVILLISLALGGTAFGLVPTERDDYFSVGTQTAIVLGGSAFVLLSVLTIAAWAMLVLLKQLHIDVGSVMPGALFAINVASLVIVGLSSVVLIPAGRWFRSRTAETLVAEINFTHVWIGVAVVSGAVALFGLQPIVHAIRLSL